MKKFSMFIATLFVASSVWAQEYFKVDGIVFRITGDDDVSIGHSTYSGDLVIPSSVTYDGKSYNVTSIEDAFSDCTGLTSVTIPNGVTSIGSLAFFNCSGLTSITLPNSVTSIGYEAFWGCSGLTSITIPKSVNSIAPESFSGCNGLTSISILDGVTSIEGGAFFNCTGLTSITIPNSVYYIAPKAFSGCESLTSITCLSKTPAIISAAPFDDNGANITVYVPYDAVSAYKSADVWKDLNIQPISSEEISLSKDEVAVVPEKTEAVFSMPKNEDANSYTLTIQNNGVTFCTLTFNAQGQLANIDFSTNKSYELKSGVEAFQFTVTGLSTAEDYGYSFKALASNKSVLKEYSGSFTTKNEDGTGGSVQGGGQGGQGGSTAVSEVSNATAVIIANGQILVNGEAPAFVVTVSGKKATNANLKSGVYFVVAEGNSVSVVVR